MLWNVYRPLRRWLQKSPMRIDLRVERRPSGPPNRTNTINLNVGAGQYRIDGFQSLDNYHQNYHGSRKRFFRNGYVQFDLTNDALPYDSGSVDNIYCSHVLEHVPLESSARFLAECRRVLKPGGVLRIVVPNAEALFEAFQVKLNMPGANRILLEEELFELVGTNDALFFARARFHSIDSFSQIVTAVGSVPADPKLPGQHIYAFGFETIDNLLGAGRGDWLAVRSMPGSSVSSEMRGYDMDISRHDFSLYVDAVRKA